MTAPAPQAPAVAAPYTPVVTDLMRLARAPFAPTAVFEEQQDRPTFWMPFLIVSVAWTALQLLLQPFQRRATELAMAQAGRPVPAGSGSQVMTFITAPLTVLVMSAIAAGVLYMLVAAFGGETTFKKMLTVTIFTWPITVLTQVLTWVVLTMRGIDSITGPTDMMVSLGLDNLLPSSVQLGYFLRFLLAGVGPLQIWSLAITAIGIGVLAKLGKGSAWTAATVSYVIFLLFGAGVATLGMKALGG